MGYRTCNISFVFVVYSLFVAVETSEHIANDKANTKWRGTSRKKKCDFAFKFSMYECAVHDVWRDNVMCFAYAKHAMASASIVSNCTHVIQNAALSGLK